MTFSIKVLFDKNITKYLPESLVFLSSVDDSLITDQNDILQEEVKLYSALYSEKHSDNTSTPLN